MSSSSVGGADGYLTGKVVPLTFFSLKHTSWTKDELTVAVRVLGGESEYNASKMDLNEQLHTLRPVGSLLSSVEELNLGLARNKAAEERARKVAANAKDDKM